MTIKTLLAVKEGIVLSGTEKGLGLGFGSEMAHLIAENYNTVIIGESRGTVTVDTVDGRNPNQLAVMIGLEPEPEAFKATFNVYPLGQVEGEGCDLYVAELEGDRLAIAYCDTGSFADIQEDPEDSIMSSLVFDQADIAEVLEALGQDFSELPSQED